MGWHLRSPWHLCVSFLFGTVCIARITYLRLLEVGTHIRKPGRKWHTAEYSRYLGSARNVSPLSAPRFYYPLLPCIAYRPYHFIDSGLLSSSVNRRSVRQKCRRIAAIYSNRVNSANMPRPVVGSRLPPDIHEEMERLRRDLGLSKSEAVQRAIRDWVNKHRIHEDMEGGARAIVR